MAPEVSRGHVHAQEGNIRGGRRQARGQEIKRRTERVSSRARVGGLTGGVGDAGCSQSYA